LQGLLATTPVVASQQPSSVTAHASGTIAQAIFAPEGDVIAATEDGSPVRYCRSE
jgi:hypothetical protein